MQIYQATNKDVDQVAELFNSYRLFYEQPSDIEGAKAFLKERLEKQESVIFIVKKDQQYLGFTQLYPSFSSVSMKRVWILNDLFVAETARKQGVGELLLQKAKEFALENGAKSLSLSTAIDNVSAQRLYEKHGYQRDTHYVTYELVL